MDISILNYIFNFCIILGFVIPLLNLLTGWFGSFFGGGDLDMGLDAGTDASFDIDMDLDLDLDLDIDIDLGSAGMQSSGDSSVSAGKGSAFPFNVMCLCLFLVAFGALGQAFKRMMTSLLPAILLLAACFAAASLLYWVLYKFIVKRLKNSDSSAMSLSDLPGKNATVMLSIHANSIGTISLRDSTGAAISFRAKIDAHLADRMPDVINKGETVFITEVDLDNKLCYVSTFFNRQ